MILRSLRSLKELERAQYLPAASMKELQSERLKAIVTHAYEKAPYYRDLFRGAGIEPADIRDVRDIRKIPITTKKDLQERPLHELLSAGVREEDCVVKHTSGSTGLPLQFLFSPRERDFQSLLNLRIFMAGGLNLFDKTAYLINPARFAKGQYWFQRFGILRRYYLSVFEDPEIHRRELARIKPQILYGYPSNLTLLAMSMKEEGNVGINPKVVFSSAEALETVPRKLISSAMHADVLDILGLVETGDLAWECRAHEGYHLNCDAVITELLDTSDQQVQPGQEGRLVCTSLYSYAMPLIRYDAGDRCVATDASCSCGRTLPMLRNIQGRANDFIVLPNGKIIASCFLVIIMQTAHDIAQYRIIQESRRELRVEIVKGRNFCSSTPLKIKEQIEKIAGGGLEAQVRVVDSLERDLSGKIRTIVSKVEADFKTSPREHGVV